MDGAVERWRLSHQRLCGDAVHRGCRSGAPVLQDGPEPVGAGLTNGTTYTFKVAARNGAGVGPQSAASAPIAPAALPGPPTIGAAVAGPGQVTLSWTAPPPNGGPAVTSYVVT